jgi:hypothetical protein
MPRRESQPCAILREAQEIARDTRKRALDPVTDPGERRLKPDQIAAQERLIANARARQRGEKRIDWRKA